MKPLPVTVIVNAVPPATAALGEIDNKAGAGFEVPPPPAPPPLPDVSDFLQDTYTNSKIAIDSSLVSFIYVDLFVSEILVSTNINNLFGPLGRILLRIG